MTYYALQKDVFDINKVTVVGSPTITSDGVLLSDKNADNYVSIPSLLDVRGDTYKLEFIFKTPEQFTNSGSYVLGLGGLEIYIWRPSSYQFYYRKQDGSAVKIGDLSVTINTEYNIVFLIQNNIIKAGYKPVNSRDYTYFTKDLGTTGIQTTNLFFLKGQNVGTIPLSSIKITTNGTTFSPAKPTYLLERRKPKVWNKGQFTIVGNPSISDEGVASGLSNNDYIVPTSLTLEQLKGKSWSYSFKCTIPDTSASSKYIISFANNVYPSLVGGIKFEGYGIYLGGKYGTTEDSTNELWKLIGTYSRPADVGKEVLITASFNIETGEYNAKAILDNKELNMTPYIPPTANKELYYINTNSSSKAFRVLVGNDKFYLKSLKIYTDNTLVFDGGADTYVYDSNKFTIVGSPTITEYGVASGFSANNYIIIPNYIANKDNFKITGKWICGAINETILGLTGQGWGSVLRTWDGNKGLVCGLTNTSLSTNSGNCVIGRAYDFSIEYQNNSLILGLSTDGENFVYVSATEQTLNAFVNSSANIYIGVIADHKESLYMQGSIDLPSFSITVDGKEVFTGAKENYYMLRR